MNLKNTGIFQADAYGGYNKFYEPDRKPGPISVNGRTGLRTAEMEI